MNWDWLQPRAKGGIKPQGWRHIRYLAVKHGKPEIVRPLQEHEEHYTTHWKDGRDWLCRGKECELCAQGIWKRAKGFLPVHHGSGAEVKMLLVTEKASECLSEIRSQGVKLTETLIKVIRTAAHSSAPLVMSRMQTSTALPPLSGTIDLTPSVLYLHGFSVVDVNDFVASRGKVG